MEPNTNPLPQIAKAILERLNDQYPKKGALRNKAALEMTIGSFIALQVLGQSAPADAFICQMVAIRGASWIEETAAKA